MRWYKITAKETHCGGKKGIQVLYLWEKDVAEVIKKYKSLRGVPRTEIPNIRQLNSEEVSILEKAIINERNWSIENAKKKIVRYDARGNCLPPI